MQGSVIHLMGLSIEIYTLKIIIEFFFLPCREKWEKIVLPLDPCKVPLKKIISILRQCKAALKRMLHFNASSVL